MTSGVTSSVLFVVLLLLFLELMAYFSSFISNYHVGNRFPLFILLNTHIHYKKNKIVVKTLIIKVNKKLNIPSNIQQSFVLH